MPNIFHQSVEDILKAATPEQKILWNDIFLRLNERCAVSQYVYFGSIAGAAELTTFTQRKIYLAYEANFGYTNSIPLITGGMITLYNETNGAYFYAGNNNVFYDGAAASIKFTINTLKLKNMYFSRFVTSNYNTVSFVGYRISY